MAIKAYVESNPVDEFGGVLTECRIFTWVLNQGDSGTPVRVPTKSEKTIQFLGTIGAAGHAILEGTNEESGAANYQPLTDPQGNNIDKTSLPALEVVTENPLEIRPRTSGGDGTTAITCKLIATSPRRAM